MRLLEKKKLRFSLGERGVSLLETVLSLGLFGIIGIALLQGLTSSSNTIMLSQENVAAESLAKSQVEYLKIQNYILVDDYNTDTNCYDTIDIPADLASRDYEVEISTPIAVINPDLGPFECQSINVTITRGSEIIFIMSTYKYGSSS